MHRFEGEITLDGTSSTIMSWCETPVGSETCKLGNAELFPRFSISDVAICHPNIHAVTCMHIYIYYVYIILT